MVVIIGPRFKVLVPVIVDFRKPRCRSKAWTPRSTPSKPPPRKATFFPPSKVRDVPGSFGIEVAQIIAPPGPHSNAGRNSDLKKASSFPKISGQSGRYRRGAQPRPRVGGGDGGAFRGKGGQLASPANYL